MGFHEKRYVPPAVTPRPRHIVVDLVGWAERIAASRTWAPEVYIRCGAHRHMVYVGSLN